MKIKRSIFCMIVLILLAGSINIDAASAATLPPNEPWTKEYVDRYPGAQVGTHLSIAHHPTTGRAYISYYDADDGDLWMAHEVDPGTGNCHNNNDWYCQLIDSEGDVGRYSSIDVVRVPAASLRPAYTKIGISYFDYTNGGLKFASYRSFPFPGSWTIYQVDERVWVGHETRGTFSSMKFGTNYDPVIAYHAQSDAFTEYGSVKIAHYVNSGGEHCNSVDGDHWVCETIDRVDSETELDHGTHASLDFTYSGSVQVAFYNAQLNSLDLATSGYLTGSCSNQEWNCVTIDVGLGLERGEYVSLHSKDSIFDKTRLAYYSSGGTLRYAESVNSGGNCFSSSYNCYRVDTVGEVLGHFGISMDVDSQGQPIIAYMDASEELGPTKLMVARPAFVYDELIGNCGDIPYGYLFPYWYCKTLDGGSGYTEEASFVGVSVSSAGLATVAYSEFNNYDDEIYLKVIQQHFPTYLPVILK